MVEQLRVTGTDRWSTADIMAQLTEDRGVKAWFRYKESGLKKNELTCTPQEWDRLVAWVDWQRKDKATSRGED